MRKRAEAQFFDSSYYTVDESYYIIFFNSSLPYQFIFKNKRFILFDRRLVVV